MRRIGLVLFGLTVIGASACGDGSSEVAGQGGASSTSGAGGAVAHGSGGASVATTGTGGGSGGAGGSAPEVCGCVLGDGPYCGGRIAALAGEHGCTTPFLAGHESDLMKCEDGVWSVLEDCSGACAFDPASEELDDACVLPDCACFVQVAWCGSGAAKKAADMGCKIPLLPEHDGDILYCPGGQWDVKQSCALGCVEAPDGTPDYCKSDSEYRLPFDCGVKKTCSNGNHTSSHSGKDEYAYDFATPVGTDVRAMRAGTVLRVRNVSSPGDACYDGGGSACANYANTVEVKHSDGTVALYMHLSKTKVTKGQPVAQGDLVGLSGNSGWTTGPHLHVQVQQDCGIWWCQSQPFKFVEDPTISAGTQVTSENHCP
jgi:hypothetical protein